MRGVGSKRQTPPDSVWGCPRSAGRSGVGELEMTVQPSGGLHGELEGGLEVRLLEGGEDAARVRHLELCVQVGLLVDRVDEAVQALAGVGVRAVGDDPQLVAPGGQGRQRDPAVLEHLGRVERGAVEHHLVDGGCDQVDEGGGAGLGGVEAHGGHRPVRAALLRAGQVELDLVGVDGEQPRPLLGLFAGQIRSGHQCISLTSRLSGHPSTPSR
ncbi:hypothetical protein GCM10020000_54210 [Streptomyces olivoverticillatus]